MPEDHPGSQTPWLPTLITGLETITTYLDERFLSRHLEETPEPIPLETFEAAISRDKEPADPWLARFLQIEAFMRELAHLEAPPDPEEAYDRYKKWLPFAHRNRAFYEASARTSATSSRNSKADPASGFSSCQPALCSPDS